MTCTRSPCTFSSRVIGRSSHSGPLQGVVTLGTIGQMALVVSAHHCQHYSGSGQARPRVASAATWTKYEISEIWPERLSPREAEVGHKTAHTEREDALTTLRLASYFPLGLRVSRCSDPCTLTRRHGPLRVSFPECFGNLCTRVLGRTPGKSCDAESDPGFCPRRPICHDLVSTWADRPRRGIRRLQVPAPCGSRV